MLLKFPTIIILPSESKAKFCPSWKPEPVDVDCLLQRQLPVESHLVKKKFLSPTAVIDMPPKKAVPPNFPHTYISPFISETIS